MSYFVVVTFDLNHKATADDYANAYADLATLGLSRTIKGSNGNQVTLPNTTVAGEWQGTSAAALRDAMRENVKTAFAKRGFTSEIFVSVGGDWSWGYATTGSK